MRQPMRSRCGLAPMTDRAFVSGRSTSITFGHIIIDFVHHRRVQPRVSGDQSKEKLNSTDVIDALTDLFIIRDVPTYIRSDNGPEFTAEAVEAMDQGRGRGDRVYRARVTLGERLLPKLQRPFQGRTLERGYSIP